MHEHEKIEELTESLKKYVGTNYELIKLEAAQSLSSMGAGITNSLLLGLIGILFVFFISLSAGFYLSIQLGNMYSGFAIIAGVYLISGLLLFAIRKKIEKPIRDKIIEKIFTKK